MQLTGSVVVGFAAMLVAAALSAFVLRTGPSRVANRRLALVLALEAVFLGSLAYLQLAYGAADARQPRWLEALTFTSIVAVSAAYLALLAILDTPLVRAFRPAWVRASLAAFVIVMGGMALAFGTPATDNGEGVGAVVTGLVGTAGIILVGLFAIVAAVSAYRRTQAGTTRRAQARAFVVAFVTRDAAWVIGTSCALALSNTGHDSLGQLWWSYGGAFTVLLYAPLLAYGILRSQLFDIDVKLKIGIRRSSVATIMLLVVFGAAKVAELYLNKTFGFIAGGVAAGAMLVLAPRLNKLGDKMASTAMPKVDATPGYTQFRKLEVYKAALESAHEGGPITPKERQTLDRLRDKLGISPADAAALEADIATAVPA